jgi:hypothetical protein
MNCRNVEPLLLAYLDEDIAPAEKKHVQDHLNDCPDCRKQLDSLTSLQRRLKRHFQVTVASATPSPQSWNRLYAEISMEDPAFAARARRPAWFGSSQSTGPLFKRLALAVLVLVVLTVAVPPARALTPRIQQLFNSWFHFKTPSGGGGIQSFDAFIPYNPAYLPHGFQHTGTGGHKAPEADALELDYSDGRNFITLIQSKGPGADRLPEGVPVVINGETGVFVESYASGADELRQKLPAISITEGLDYQHVRLLAWRIAEIKFELLSNLPESELVKVAASLQPMEPGAGKFSPPPFSGQSGQQEVGGTK